MPGCRRGENWPRLGPPEKRSANKYDPDRVKRGPAPASEEVKQLDPSAPDAKLPPDPCRRLPRASARPQPLAVFGGSVITANAHLTFHLCASHALSAFSVQALKRSLVLSRFRDGSAGYWYISVRHY